MQAWPYALACASLQTRHPRRGTGPPWVTPCSSSRPGKGPRPPITFGLFARAAEGDQLPSTASTMVVMTALASPGWRSWLGRTVVTPPWGVRGVRR